MSDNHLYAKVSLPLPGLSREVQEMAQKIRDGGEGSLFGSELLSLLVSFFGAKDLGECLADGAGHNTDIAITKKADGRVGYFLIYPAARYNADMVRSIVAVCVTPRQHTSSYYRYSKGLKIPTINDLMDRVKGGNNP